VMVSQ